MDAHRNRHLPGLTGILLVELVAVLAKAALPAALLAVPLAWAGATLVARGVREGRDAAGPGARIVADQANQTMLLGAVVLAATGFLVLNVR